MPLRLKLPCLALLRQFAWGVCISMLDGSTLEMSVISSTVVGQACINRAPLSRKLCNVCSFFGIDRMKEDLRGEELFRVEHVGLIFCVLRIHVALSFAKPNERQKGDDSFTMLESCSTDIGIVSECMCQC
jgi:hypothetical protein